MRFPQAAPPLEQVVPWLTPEVVAWAMTRQLEGRNEEERAYRHWDDLRHRPLPAGLASREQWWAALQWERLTAMRHLAGLKDKEGRPWRVVVAPSLHAVLSRLDRQLALRVLTDEPQALSPAVRNAYVLEYLTQEAWASSFIEGAAATREQAREMVAKARPPRTVGERMVLNNYRALGLVREWKDQPLTPGRVLQLQALLVEGTDIKAEDVGRLRLRPVVVSTPENEVLHEPPAFEELPARLTALCAFANADDGLHPVVRAVALHFMLAYDHPFGDGNGRTARALFYWSMLRAGYGLVEFMPISDVIRRAPAQYGRAFLLAETDNQDFTHFLVHQLGVLEQAGAEFSGHLARRREGEAALRRATDVPGLSHRQREALRSLLAGEAKVLSFDAHARLHGITYVTARKDLEGLLAGGWLEERPKEGKRRLFALGAKGRERAAG